MRILVDAFGGDNAPAEIIKGCRRAADELGLQIILCGSAEKIRACAAQLNVNIADMEILDCPDVILTEDSPAQSIKKKPQSSMVMGLKALAAGEADAFASAGNSGALVVGATLLVKRIKGIKRVAFAPVLPGTKNSFMLIDSGANVECRPEYLLQFGIMGSAYMQKVMGVGNPRVGLANVGVEDHKGAPLQQQAYGLLQSSALHFTGNIEGREIPTGSADVVVCDGFTGNMMVKMYEGVAMGVMDKFKGVFRKSLKNKLAAAVVLKDMKALKRSLDYNEFGGSPIIGASKPVFKIHGSAKEKTVFSALKLLKAYVENNVVAEIADAVRLYNEQNPIAEEEAGA